MQIGHLDSIVDGEISGWALDSDSPDEAVKLAVYLDGRFAAEALAVYHRPDVAEHFKTSGRHGFYVDLRSEHACEASIDVRLPDGGPLHGAPMRAAIPPRPLKHRPTLLFMHIPKAAGTSFREAIARNYKTSEIAYLYPQEPGFRIRNLEELPLDQRSRAGLIAGHEVYYGVHQYIPNECLYFPVVRDPISRVWSNYIHVLQTKDARIFNGVKPESLEEIFESKSRGDMDNVMVRFFSGSPYVPVGTVNRDIYEMAKANARLAFPYIGQQTNLHRAYAWLREKLDWRNGSAVPVMNVTEYNSTPQCSEADRKIIRHFNEWDCRLYEDLLAFGAACA